MTLKLHINNINEALLHTRSLLPSTDQQQPIIKAALESIKNIASDAHYERAFEDDGTTPEPERTIVFRPIVDGIQTHLTLDFFDPNAILKTKVTVGNSKPYRITDPTYQSQICNIVSQEIMPYLDGNSSELISREPVEHIGNEFWDPSWKNSPAGEFYQSTIYPQVTAYAHRLLKEKNQKVLEICAGNGELAGMILDNFGNRIAEYHMAELNNESLVGAQRNLKEKTKTGQVVLHKADIVETPDYRALTGGKKVNLVIGCGALNHMVVHCRECALGALQKITDVLEVGGKLVLTGKSRSYITSEDLQNDYKVMNASIPWTSSHFPLYVAIKKGPPVVEIEPQPTQSV